MQKLITNFVKMAKLFWKNRNIFESTGMQLMEQSMQQKQFLVVLQQLDQSEVTIQTTERCEWEGWLMMIDK